MQEILANLFFFNLSCNFTKNKYILKSNSTIMGNCMPEYTDNESQYFSGIIINRSNDTYQYLIYGAFEQNEEERQAQINPKLKMKLHGGEMELGKIAKKQKIIKKYTDAAVSILPGQSSVFGLSRLKKGAHKLTISQDKITLLSGVIINSVTDVMLVINQNGHIRSLSKSEGEKKIQEYFNEQTISRVEELQEAYKKQQQMTKLKQAQIANKIEEMQMFRKKTMGLLSENASLGDEVRSMQENLRLAAGQIHKLQNALKKE